NRLSKIGWLVVSVPSIASFSSESGRLVKLVIFVSLTESSRRFLGSSPRLSLAQFCNSSDRRFVGRVLNELTVPEQSSVSALTEDGLETILTLPERVRRERLAGSLGPKKVRSERSSILMYFKS